MEHFHGNNNKKKKKSANIHLKSHLTFIHTTLHTWTRSYSCCHDDETTFQLGGALIIAYRITCAFTQYIIPYKWKDYCNEDFFHLAMCHYERGGKRCLPFMLGFFLIASCKHGRQNYDYKLTQITSFNLLPFTRSPPTCLGERMGGGVFFNIRHFLIKFSANPALMEKACDRSVRSQWRHETVWKISFQEICYSTIQQVTRRILTGLQCCVNLFQLLASFQSIYIFQV